MGILIRNRGMVARDKPRLPRICLLQFSFAKQGLNRLEECVLAGKPVKSSLRRIMKNHIRGSVIDWVERVKKIKKNKKWRENAGSRNAVEKNVVLGCPNAAISYPSKE